MSRTVRGLPLLTCLIIPEVETTYHVYKVSKYNPKDQQLIVDEPEVSYEDRVSCGCDQKTGNRITRLCKRVVSLQQTLYAFGKIGVFLKSNF